MYALRDGHSRQASGWAIDGHLRPDLVEAAVRSAVVMRGADVTVVIVYADRGCRYTSQQMADVAAELGLRQSVRRTGINWDAHIESLWSTMKHEYHHRHTFQTNGEAKHCVGQWIEKPYNRKRSTVIPNSE